MNRSTKESHDLIDRLTSKASWCITHADAMDFGTKAEKAEAGKAWALAASVEEELATLLEAAGQETEAAVHRVSAASCHQHSGNYRQAVNLLRAALSAELRPAYRSRVDKLLTKCLAKAKRSVAKSARAMLATATPS